MVGQLARCAAARAAVFVLFASASGMACAMVGGKVTPFVFLQTAHDDNVFRLADDADAVALLGTGERGDTVRSIKAGIGLDVPAGRQRLTGTLETSGVRYARFGFLDYDTVDADLHGEWRVGNAWNGEVVYARSQTLSDFGDFREPRKNIRTYQKKLLRAHFQPGTTWRVKGAVAASDVNYSFVDSQGLTRRDTLSEIGVDYLTRTGNRIGATFGTLDGRVPGQQAVAGGLVGNDFTQTDRSLDVSWVPHPDVRADARLGSTRRNYHDLPNRSFDGATGYAMLDWTVTGKAALRFEAKREIGAYQDMTSNYIVTRTLALATRWAATGSLFAQVRIEHRERAFGGDPGIILLGQPQRVDDNDITILTLGYQAARFARLDFTWQKDRRNSTFAGLDYRDTYASAALTCEF